MENEGKGFWRVALGLASGLLGAGVLALVGAQPRGEPVALLPAPSPAALLVQVSGAVAEPDVVALPQGSRVLDAIEAAGGLLPEADASPLNLAATVLDGQKISVPFQPTATPFGYIPPTAVGIATSTAEVVFPLDLNTASYDELLALPGIGPVRAEAILAYREELGPFQKIEQLMNVEGIGPGIFEDLKDLIVIGDG